VLRKGEEGRSSQEKKHCNSLFEGGQKAVVKRQHPLNFKRETYD